MKNRSAIYSRYFTYIKPVTKIPIIRNYGSTIFTLLMMSILILFAIKPTIETILVLQKKLADQEEVLKQITKKAQDLSQGKKNFDNLDDLVKQKVSAAIPDSVALKSLIQTLEQSAKIHEASISALQIQPLVIDVRQKDKMGTLSEITFTFNTEGDFNNLRALLQDLKNSDRLISIENLSMGKASDGSVLIMSVSGKAYYIK